MEAPGLLAAEAVVAVAAVLAAAGPGAAQSAAGSAPETQTRCLPTWALARGE